MTTLWALRDAARAGEAGDGPVVWLGDGEAPAAVAGRAVTVAPDAPNIDGWLELRRWGAGLNGGARITETLAADGVSLWWFVQHWLLYGEGLPSYDELYRSLVRVREAAAAVGPGRIVLLGGRATDHLAARAVARKRGIGYRWRATVRTRLAAAVAVDWKVRLLTNLRYLKLAIRGLAARLLTPRPAPSPDLLFNCSSTTWDPRAAHDRVLQPLLEAVTSQRLRSLGVYLDHRRSFGLRSLSALAPAAVPWERYMNVRSLLGAQVETWRLRSRRPLADCGPFAGVNAEDVLGHRLRALLRVRLRDAVLALRSAETALADIRPRSVVVTDSYDMWPRALVVAGLRRGIPVVEVQHAMIGESHGGYLHLPGEAGARGEWRSPVSPLPDTVCVYGETSRRALISTSGLDESRVRVTGALSIMAARARLDDRERIRQRLGIPPGRLAFTYFGVPVHLWPYDDAHFEAFLSSVRDLAQVWPLLRPHPGDPSNPGRYLTMLRRAGLEGGLAAGDPWDVAIASDVVVAYNSTAAYDAAALGCAVVHINLSGVPDLLPVEDEIGAIAARSAGALGAVLKDLAEPERRRRQVACQTPRVASVFDDRALVADEILRAAAVGR